jgi:hypothetical protein
MRSSLLARLAGQTAAPPTPPMSVFPQATAASSLHGLYDGPVQPFPPQQPYAPGGALAAAAMRPRRRPTAASY